MRSKMEFAVIGDCKDLLFGVKYTVEVNGSAVVGIDFIHNVFELGVGGLETQLAHDISELLSCDFTYIRSC